MLNNSLEKYIEIKKKARGTNSFLAPQNDNTYQIDLFFTSTGDIEPKQKFRVGLVCIDVLSKYAVVVPIKSKNGPDVLAGAMEAINKMGKKPKKIYGYVWKWGIPPMK